MTKFFKPKKKFISKRKAAIELHIKLHELDKLCVYCSIYPIVAAKRQCLDKADDFYYTIDDIKQIARSDSYSNLKANKRLDSKRKTLEAGGLLERAEQVRNVEMRLIPLIKQKYGSFGESVCDLGNSLRFLYLAQLHMEEDSNVKHCITTVLNDFEQFVIDNNMLQCAFMSKNGIFYQINVEDKMVLWMVPYKIKNREEFSKEHILIPREALKSLIDLEEESEDASDDDSIIECTNERYLRYLEYSVPVLITHVKLVLFKLKMMKVERESNHKLKDCTFCIRNESIREQIEFVVNSMGGIVSETGNIVICEDVSEIEEDKMYIQPQYVFDLLNLEDIEITNYKVGMDLPTHKSPFNSIYDQIDPEMLQTLSNTKRYRLLDKIKKLE
ncbi:PESC [Enterospora canceri]|uniref:PESC n=1 Tax=Enterospora canceri TaxID=1081671 RepID=A0A1Y1S613_9MICR|nr:PESC [Enterospora canceri]